MNRKAKVKMRSFCWILGMAGAALLFFLPSGIAAQETHAAEGGETAGKEETVMTLEKLNALKAEWEGVREQQIQMIREKEETLEKMKEDMFRQLQAGAKTPPDAAAKDVSQPGASPKTIGETNPEIQAQEMLLRKKMEELAAREESLRAREDALNRKPREENEEEGVSSTGSVTDLEKEKMDFERQKSAFAAERQKFFQEMGRQKEQLRKLQVSLDEQAARLQKQRALSEKENSSKIS